MLVLTLLLLLALFILFALPGLMAITHPRGPAIATLFYMVLVVGLALHYFGLSFGGRMPAVAAPGTEAPALCGQAIEQAEGGGLIVDRTNPSRVVVSRGLWNELPEQIQDGIVMCLDLSRPADQRETPVVVVETGGAQAR
jgi:hypothetical protein